MPEILECKEFVNADEIAKGLSPFQPEKVAVEAGRIMLTRINELFEHDTTFAIETTLASKIYKDKILRAREQNYQVILLFYWLETAELAVERVRIRVEEGGHDIPQETIRRRYISGIKNLFDIYLDICDELYIFDNSAPEYKFVAKKFFGKEIEIYDQGKFNRILKYTQNERSK